MKKRTFTNGAIKLMDVPKKYKVGFLQKMDGRTEACKMLRSSFNEIISDLGGVDNLSHIQICLCERFTFLEFVLRRLEYRIANEPKQSSKLLARWVQSLNSLVGLGKSIGLERRAKKVPSLEKYISKRNRQ